MINKSPVKLACVAVTGFLFLAASVLARAEIESPDVLIKRTVQEVLEILRKDKDIRAGNQKKLLELVDAKVLPHFDFTRMTSQTVGSKNWAVATPEQKQKLEAEFRTMLVRTYSGALTQFSEYSVEVKRPKPLNDPNEVTVKTVIAKPGSPPYLVDYDMEKTPEGWKVFDVTVEAISMVETNKRSFRDEIKKTSIDGLIAMLVSMNKDATSGTARKAEAK